MNERTANIGSVIVGTYSIALKRRPWWKRLLRSPRTFVIFLKLYRHYGMPRLQSLTLACDSMLLVLRQRTRHRVAK